jgi:hypothetical protein
MDILQFIIFIKNLSIISPIYKSPLQENELLLSGFKTYDILIMGLRPLAFDIKYTTDIRIIIMVLEMKKSIYNRLLFLMKRYPILQIDIFNYGKIIKRLEIIKLQYMKKSVQNGGKDDEFFIFSLTSQIQEIMDTELNILTQIFSKLGIE